MSSKFRGTFICCILILGVQYSRGFLRQTAIHKHRTSIIGAKLTAVGNVYSNDCHADRHKTLGHSFQKSLSTSASRMQLILRKWGELLRKSAAIGCALLLFLSPLFSPGRSSAASGDRLSGSTFSSRSSTTKKSKSNSGRGTPSRSQSGMSSSSGRIYQPPPRRQPVPVVFRMPIAEASKSTVLLANERTAPPLIPIAIGISLLGASTVAFPWTSTLLKALLGLNSSAVYEIQMVYRMSKEERKSLLASLNGALNDDRKQLTDRIEELCLGLLRRQDCLVGGGMVEYRDKPSKIGVMEEQLSLIDFRERRKFDDNVIKVDESILLSAPSEGVAPTSTTLMVVTVALLSVGPVFRNRGLHLTSNCPSPLQRFRPTVEHPDVTQRKSMLEAKHFEKCFYSLPLYLKSIDRLQAKFNRDAEESDGASNQHQPGFNIKVLWTPSTADELLPESDLLAKWPSVRLF